MKKLFVMFSGLAALGASIVPAFALNSVPPAGSFEGGPGAFALGAYAYPGSVQDQTAANQAIIDFLSPVEVPTRATTVNGPNGGTWCNTYSNWVTVAGYMAPGVDARTGAAWPTCP